MNQREAMQMLKTEVKKHCPQWETKLDNRKRACGTTNFTSMTISLSRHFIKIATKLEVMDTILHEIAHVYAGSKAGHSWRWKQHARKLGATPKATTIPQRPIKGKYKFICTYCGSASYMHRLPKKTANADRACAKCCHKYNNGKFSEKYLVKRVR